MSENPNPNFFQNLLNFDTSSYSNSTPNPSHPNPSPNINVNQQNYPYHHPHPHHPYPQNNPNMFLSPDQNFSFTQGIPYFSSQCGITDSSQRSSSNSRLENLRQERMLAPIEISSIKNKRTIWAIEEDKVLISAYLNTSKDPIIGIDQSATSFWSKVATYYDNYKGPAIERDLKSCKNRWHLINGSVSKFVGAYKQARARKRSGESENDVIIQAHNIFLSDTGKRFSLMHAWCMLKDDPKWSYIGEDSSSKRTRINIQGHYSSSSEPGTPYSTNTPNTPNAPTISPNSNPETSFHVNTPSTPLSGDGDNNEEPPVVRPIGVKAAKRKAKGKRQEEGNASQRALMDDFMKVQTEMATALADTSRTKKIEIYTKLIEKDLRSEREERMMRKLEEEIFQ